ncbi:MAG: ABC transporter substrate-binding protein [Deltaproteobacteria bacterium]|nr:ABC transporter substrate-binding protein [Deltaproteobacteria bacterium]
MRPKTSLAAFALLIALLVAVPPTAAQPIRLKLGSSLSPPTLDLITPYLARDRGIFKTHGLDAEIVEFRGDAIHMKALLAGELDVSAVQGPTIAMVTASKGTKTKTILVSHPLTPYTFVARAEAAKSFQDLVGKSIAVSGIGAISYHIPRLILDRAGVDPEKVKYVALGSPADRFKALLANKIDATLITTAEAAKLDRYPQLAVLADVTKALPEMPYAVSVTTEAYIGKNPEALNKLVRAYLEANRFIRANKQGTVEIAAKVLKGETPELLAKAYDLINPKMWGLNGDLDKTTYQYVAEVLMKIGYLANPVPYEKFFDWRFVERALKEIGRL